jgi:Transposase, Mutator family
LQARSPRAHCRAHCGATQQVWGHRLRRADLRSQPANIRVAVRRSTPLRRGPGQPLPGHPTRPHTGDTKSPLTGGSPLDGAVPYQELKRRTNVVGMFPDDAAVTRLATAVLIEALTNGGSLIVAICLKARWPGSPRSTMMAASRSR